MKSKKKFNEDERRRKFSLRKVSGIGAVSAVIGIIGFSSLPLETVSAAETDMNVVMMEDGRMIEVQGTAEGEPFSHEELLTLLGLAKQGCEQIFAAQREALGL